MWSTRVGSIQAETGRLLSWHACCFVSILLLMSILWWPPDYQPVQTCLLPLGQNRTLMCDTIAPLPLPPPLLHCLFCLFWLSFLCISPSVSQIRGWLPCGLIIWLQQTCLSHPSGHRSFLMPSFSFSWTSPVADFLSQPTTRLQQLNICCIPVSPLPVYSSFISVFF